MKGMLITLILAGLPAAAAANPAGEKLFKGSTCVGCHAVDRKLVGPALKDIAAKYKGDKAAGARLVARVKNGGSGSWGPIPMPAHPGLKDADVRAMVQYVLSVQ